MELNRPVIRIDENGQRSFAPAEALLHRVELKVAVYEHQMRCELLEWRPGTKPEAHLVWQNHSRSGHREHTASLDSTRALGLVAEWLAKEAWPGIRF